MSQLKEVYRSLNSAGAKPRGCSTDLSLIKIMMIDALKAVDPEGLANDRLCKRIVFAESRDDLWTLRGDVMSAVSLCVGESSAFEVINVIDEVFQSGTYQEK
ncbi:hypothetical protein [Rhodoferax mekongensis]|uniref:hypothetical protein n=1 Tax=Rhodoferax mekongensis TaxID=3068341 RepID=UPI0028BF4918|nr:hypothetical protein [Rhodoferax sp. TBRC 17199]MDT7515381.1 hypothetical protein [Rhodoferax sp. TBRC 17199]